MKTNETEHYINEGFNLLIGFKVTRKRIQWVKNKNSKWKSVIPEMPEMFEGDVSTILIRGNATYA